MSNNMIKIKCGGEYRHQEDWVTSGANFPIKVEKREFVDRCVNEFQDAELGKDVRWGIVGDKSGRVICTVCGKPHTQVKGK